MTSYQSVTKCFDDNLKEFKVTFDCGVVGKQVILLCRSCNEKPEFVKHRVTTEKLEGTI